MDKRQTDILCKLYYDLGVSDSEHYHAESESQTDIAEVHSAYIKELKGKIELLEGVFFDE